MAQTREDRISFHFHSAHSLLPIPIVETPSHSVAKFETFLNGQGETIRAKGVEAIFARIDWLYSAFLQMEFIGDMNDCSPIFWQTLSLAAEDLREQIEKKTNSSLKQLGVNLNALGENFSDEIIYAFSQRSNISIEKAKEGFSAGALWMVLIPIDFLQHERKHNRLNDEQIQQYLERLQKLSPYLTEIEKLDPHIFATIKNELTAAAQQASNSHRRKQQ